MTAVRGPRGVAAVLLLPAIVGALAACGSLPPRIEPTGVDGLVVPSPSLRASDFVDEIDNPWLPLERGSRWRYELVTGEGVGTRTVTVAEETRTVDGVPATVVHEVVVAGDGTVESETEELFAQDTAGNVWLLGDTGAGLAMPAEPRVGDGYAGEAGESEAGERAVVLALDESASVPFGSYDDLLKTEVTSGPDAVLVQHRWYAEGIGLVRAETVEGVPALLELVELARG